MKLPDLEGLAIFAKVVELRSFARAADELGISKATVSKAISRVECRLGTRLFNRTSRRIAVTDAGRMLAEHAARMLIEAEAAENEALAQSVTPRGLIRVAVPMSFGLREVAPKLPEFLAAYPDVSVELHLSDEIVDLIGEGFDAALRIGVLPDSSLRSRRLCEVKLLLVAAPAYLERKGRPTHPQELAAHACLGYVHSRAPKIWRFTNGAGEEASVRPAGQLRANNAEALIPALLAGLGVAMLPDFFLDKLIERGMLEILMPEWSASPAALHLVTPPGSPRPARVQAFTGFLIKCFSCPE